jgi:hypothetical protein
MKCGMTDSLIVPTVPWVIHARTRALNSEIPTILISYLLLISVTLVHKT